MIYSISTVLIMRISSVVFPLRLLAVVQFGAGVLFTVCTTACKSSPSSLPPLHLTTTLCCLTVLNYSFQAHDYQLNLNTQHFNRFKRIVYISTWIVIFKRMFEFSFTVKCCMLFLRQSKMILRNIKPGLFAIRFHI